METKRRRREESNWNKKEVKEKRLAGENKKAIWTIVLS